MLHNISMFSVLQYLRYDYQYQDNKKLGQEKGQMFW